MKQLFAMMAVLLLTATLTFAQGLPPTPPAPIPPPVPDPPPTANVMNQFIADDILNAFTQILISGFLRVHESVELWLGVLLIVMLVLSMALCIRFAHQPYVLLAMGALWFRALVIVTIFRNWDTIANGLLNGLVSIGLSLNPGGLTPAEFLSPGRIFYLGAMLSQNFVWLIAQMGDAWYKAPLLFFAYYPASLILWVVFALISFFVMVSVIEFQLVSFYAFLAWPLLATHVLAYIAADLARTLIASALRISALAAMLSIALPFAMTVAIGGTGDATVQGAWSLSFGLLMLAGLIWVGPQAIGASSMPGRSLLQLGMLTWASLRRAA
jgi:hypothetical protein